MKSVFKISTTWMLSLLLVIACKTSEEAGSEDATPSFGIQIDEVESHDFLNLVLTDEELKDFESGPSYEWMTSPSLKLAPSGNWKKIVAFQEIDKDQDINVAKNDYEAVVNQVISLPGSDVGVTFIHTEETGLMTFRDIRGTFIDAIASMDTKVAGEAGYIHRKVIDRNANTPALLVHFGWVYKSGDDTPFDGAMALK